MDIQKSELKADQELDKTVDLSKTGGRSPHSAQTDELPAGTVFASKYEILECIGEGGMSVVYKARDQMLNRTVAIKLLTAARAKDKNSRLRFKQEARATARLNHPNIVRIHEFEVPDESQPYLVMDFLDGTPLSDVIVMEGKMGPNRTLELALQVCSALDQAHSYGVVHRDLKPSNIILSTTEEGKDHVFVVDFGIAKLMPQDGAGVTQLTQTGEVFGSPLYMSPEQCMGGKLDGRSDIYSFGCVMYEMLTGRPPFVGENPVHTVMRQLNDDPVPFKKVRPDLPIPQSLEHIVFKCLAKKADDRYDSVAALKADLLKIVQGATIDARSSSWTTVKKGVKRADPLIVTVGALILLVIGAAVYIVTASMLKPNVEHKVQTMGFDNKFALAMNDQARIDSEKEPDAVKRTYAFQDFTDVGLKYVTRMEKLQELNVQGANITDKGLALISGMNIMRLDLSGTEITDNGLKEIRKMPSLNLLSIRSTDVGDEGLRNLRGMRTLRSIKLGHSHVTDEGLKALADLPNLGYVEFATSLVTDKGCEVLGGIPHITAVNLASTKISDRGVKMLSRNRNLQAVEINGCELTDASVSSLSLLPRLSYLDMAWTKVTDRSVPALSKMRYLTQLNLSGTRVTEKGKAEIRIHLPRCSVM